MTLNRSSRADRIAVSFPIVVASLGFVGWMVQSLSRNLKKQPQDQRNSY